MKALAQQYIEENSIQDEDEHDYKMWALAAYKITYDAEYRSFQNVDWSQIDEELGLSDDDETDDEIPEAENYWSFPWIFQKKLCMLV